MELRVFFSLAVVLVSVVVFKLLKVLKRAKTDGHPPSLDQAPGPWKLPLIGSIHHFAVPYLLGTPLHHPLRDLASKHGAFMHLQLGENSTIVVSSPELAKEVLLGAFADRHESLAAEIITYKYANLTFSPSGKYHTEMRKKCKEELLNLKKVKSFSFIRKDEVSRLINSIRSSLGSPINLSEKISLMTMAIISRAAVGERCKYQDALLPLIKEAIEMTGGVDVSDLFPSLNSVLRLFSPAMHKLNRLHKAMDEILNKIINERKQNPESSEGGNGEARKEDLLDELLKLTQMAGGLYKLDNVKAVILDIFFAGTDTSSATVEWAMSELMKNPEVMEKTQAEVRKALRGNPGKKIIDTDNQENQDLKYLNLVIKETLRLHPPFPLVARQCSEQQDKVAEYQYRIPIKTKVLVNVWAMGRNRDYWGDDAESFRPERFESNPIEYGGADFKYIPFGAGTRMCPGRDLGLANVKLPLAQLLYHFDWKLQSGTNPADLDMSETFGATSRRKSNLRLIATPYLPPDRHE